MAQGRVSSRPGGRGRILLYYPVSQQPVAMTRDGLQQSSVGTQRLAYRGDLRLQRVFLNRCARPYAVHQIILVDQLAGRLDQRFDDFERPAANLGRSAVQPHLAAREIDFPRAEPVDGPSVMAWHRCSL